MQTIYQGLKEITGNIIVLEGVEAPVYDEIIKITLPTSVVKTGKVIQIMEDMVIALVFEGTADFSLTNTSTRFMGKPMEISLSKEILGRVFDGMGQPLDGLGPIYGEFRHIGGSPINPVLRTYPREHIHTGISAIDCLATLVRGQKLPIFSGDGLPHDQLAAQIARQANIDDNNFAVVFAAMGVKYDIADYFKKCFEESGASKRVVMYLNLASDPAASRIITPRIALTAAEYLAFEKNMHVLVILTDMTAYAEALREISSARGEIPSRKGYPGYLYSDLASIYERAGIIATSPGSLTQIPILTMPSDDITHPIADLTGYITEGQIVLDRQLYQRGVYPPINILPSLSRLMKDSIGKGRTREDHAALANDLFSSYAQVGDARALASVIGAEELSNDDKVLMAFGKKLETCFIGQGLYENRQLDETLDIGLALLQSMKKS